jgi:hypothetical protein
LAFSIDLGGASIFGFSLNFGIPSVLIFSALIGGGASVLTFSFAGGTSFLGFSGFTSDFGTASLDEGSDFGDGIGILILRRGIGADARCLSRNLA